MPALITARDTTSTIVVKCWSEVPATIRGDCMLKVSTGVHKHVRLGLTIVNLGELADSHVSTMFPQRLDALLGK